jgi:hypothetical protein
LVQRRAFLLGRDGLCAVMSTALKADIRDHVLGVIIAGASKSSAFAVDATNKFHVASLCRADNQQVSSVLAGTSDSHARLSERAGRKGGGVSAQGPNHFPHRRGAARGAARFREQISPRAQGI